MEFASLMTVEASAILEGAAPIEKHTRDRKAWPAAVGVGLLLACAVGFSACAPRSASDTLELGAPGAPAALQLFRVPLRYEAARMSAVAMINSVLAELPDPTEPNATVTVSGPAAKRVCKANTFLIFDVKEIKGLSSCSAVAVFQDATVSGPWRVTGELAANISFAAPISVALELHEKGSRCHVPRSYRQTVVLSISRLSISSEFLFSEHDFPRPTVTSASFRFLKLRWDDIGLDCEGQGCPKVGGQDREWARMIVEEILSDHIVGMINSQLADMVPYKIPLQRDGGELGFK